MVLYLILYLPGGIVFGGRVGAGGLFSKEIQNRYLYTSGLVNRPGEYHLKEINLIYICKDSPY